LAPVLALLLAAGPALGQVGHDPAHSPYRDVRRGAGFQLIGGYLAGDRGRVAVGLAEIQTVLGRYELALGAPTRLALELGYGQGNRFVLDPREDSTSRRTGPVDDDVFFVSAALQLMLTGRKTWRGFAPYVGGAAGLALGAGEPEDPGGYDFGTKFTVAPFVGLRWYPAARLHVSGEARLQFWKLSYPTSYQVPGPDGSVILPPLEDALTEWVSGPWYRVGLGWTF
jgi:hypothetical protein